MSQQFLTQKFLDSSTRQRNITGVRQSNLSIYEVAVMEGIIRQVAKQKRDAACPDDLCEICKFKTCVFGQAVRWVSAQDAKKGGEGDGSNT
jgi:hypothetical protein